MDAPTPQIFVGPRNSARGARIAKNIIKAIWVFGNMLATIPFRAAVTSAVDNTSTNTPQSTDCTSTMAAPVKPTVADFIRILFNISLSLYCLENTQSVMMQYIIAIKKLAFVPMSVKITSTKGINGVNREAIGTFVSSNSQSSLGSAERSAHENFTPLRLNI